MQISRGNSGLFIFVLLGHYTTIYFVIQNKSAIIFKYGYTSFAWEFLIWHSLNIVCVRGGFLMTKHRWNISFNTVIISEWVYLWNADKHWVNLIAHFVEHLWVPILNYLPSQYIIHLVLLFCWIIRQKVLYTFQRSVS